KILREAQFFSPLGISLQPSGYLRHRQTFDLGPSRITPFLNDHSAFDAYSLLIEGDGRRLFYTGDMRAHGRKAGLFEELLRRPPRARVIREQAFDRTEAVKAHRIYSEELVARRGELVMLFRTSMSRELEEIGCLEGARTIWSMWPGYLREASGERLRAWLDRL